MAVMTNKEAYELSVNADFRKYVVTGITEIATEVLDEDPSLLEPIVSSKRVSLAQFVINDFKNKIRSFMTNLAIQEDLNKNITIDVDGIIVWAGGGDFSGAVNTYIVTVWNYIAGVTYEDLNP